MRPGETQFPCQFRDHRPQQNRFTVSNVKNFARHSFRWHHRRQHQSLSHILYTGQVCQVLPIAYDRQPAFYQGPDQAREDGWVPCPDQSTGTQHHGFQPDPTSFLHEDFGNPFCPDIFIHWRGLHRVFPNHQATTMPEIQAGSRDMH